MPAMSEPDPVLNTTDRMLRAVKQLRRSVSRLVVLAVIGVLAVTTSAWPKDGAMHIVMVNLGFVLLLVCAFGRLWASLYIEGFKNARLITVGPYSLVRNPLYVFSLCGALGIGLSAGSLIITGLLCIPFLVWFPLMVIEEERVLAARHPEEWAAYAASTPRFIPALRAPVVPEAYTVNARRVGRAFTDAIWFPLAGLFIAGFDTAHRAGVLPVLWQLR